MAEQPKPSDRPETPGRAPERPDIDRRDRRNTFGTETDPDIAYDRPDEDDDPDLDEDFDIDPNRPSRLDRPRR